MRGRLREASSASVGGGWIIGRRDRQPACCAPAGLEVQLRQKRAGGGRAGSARLPGLHCCCADRGGEFQAARLRGQEARASITDSTDESAAVGWAFEERSVAPGGHALPRGGRRRPGEQCAIPQHGCGGQRPSLSQPKIERLIEGPRRRAYRGESVWSSRFASNCARTHIALARREFVDILTIPEDPAGHLRHMWIENPIE